MQFRLGGTGAGAGIGCGSLIALLGLILISPVGEWLIKAVGWIFLAVGVLVVAATIYYWIQGQRPDEPV